MKAPSISALRAFSSAADFGSFRMAAEHLNLTESAISYQVRSLEAAYGVKLFERDKATVRLTAQGRRYHELIRQPLQDLIDATEQLSSQVSVTSIRMTLPFTFATHWLLPRFQFQPNKELRTAVRFVVSDSILNLKNNDLEIAIRHLPTAEPPENATLLFEEYAFPAHAPGFSPVPPGIEALRLSGDLLLNEGHLNEWHDFFEREGLAAPEASPLNRLNGSDMILTATASGLGIGLARIPIVDHFLQDAKLLTPYGTHFKTGFSYYLIVRDGENARTLVTGLANWLCEQAADYRGEIASFDETS